MRHLARSLLLGGVAFLISPVVTLSGCSNDDASAPPAAMGGSGGAGGSPGGTGGGGGSGSGGGAGSGGGSGSGAGGAAGADTQAACMPVFLDAGVTPDAGGDAGDAGPRASNGPVSFAADLLPILEANCGPCHTTDYIAGHNIASADGAAAYGFAKDLGGTTLERVNGGGMPPSCSGLPGDDGCISVAALDLIRRWTAQCFPP